MLEKIISGGQDGVDHAALLAAASFGIQTGGWMTKDFRCHSGVGKERARIFGLKPVPHSYDYKVRTRWNVRDSDATLRLAADFSSPGEICTMKAISIYEKPHLDVMFMNGRATVNEEDVAKWLIANNVKILNVAGNSEKTWPESTKVAKDFLKKVISLLP